MYLRDKFEKHTIENLVNDGVVSVYNNSDYENYKSFTIETFVSGAIEVDSFYRKNIVHYYEMSVGSVYNNGDFISDRCNYVKVVKFDQIARIHSYPTISTDLLNVRCAECNRRMFC